MYKNPKERERYDNQANLFAIISTIEQLEKAYIRDCITPNEWVAVFFIGFKVNLLNKNLKIERYTDSCSNLLTQFKTAFKLVEHEFKKLEDFVKKYKVIHLKPFME